MNARIPITLVPDLTAYKVGWGIVGKAWQDNSPHCEECPNNNTTGQMHPYGEGQAFEACSECTLGQYAQDKYTDCPAWQAQQQENEHVD